MRRYLTQALVIGLLLSTGAMMASPAAAHTGWHDFSRWERRQCRLGPFGSDPHVKLLIRCAHRQVGQRADIGMSLMIADHESGFEPGAYNSSSGAGGLYQWLASSWPGRARFPKMFRQFGLPDSRFDARAAAFASARVMAGPGGFGPWCGFTSYC